MTDMKPSIPTPPMQTRTRLQTVSRVIAAIILIGGSALLSQTLAVLLSSIISGAVSASSGIAMSEIPNAGSHNTTVFALCNLISFALPALLTYFVAKKLFGYELGDMHLPRTDVVKDLGLGYLIGAVMITLIFVIALFSGAVSVREMHTQIVLIIVFAAFFFIQSGTEEFIMRGLVTTGVERTWGRIAAILIPSVLFALMHLGNADTNALSILNTILVGIVFSLMMYVTESLWVSMAAHAAWNTLQSVVFGFPVSGMHLPSLGLELDIVNPALVGGAYGPESSLLFSGLALVMIVGLTLLLRRQTHSSSHR